MAYSCSWSYSSKQKTWNGAEYESRTVWTQSTNKEPYVGEANKTSCVTSRGFIPASTVSSTSNPSYTTVTTSSNMERWTGGMSLDQLNKNFVSKQEDTKKTIDYQKPTMRELNNASYKQIFAKAVDYWKEKDNNTSKFKQLAKKATKKNEELTKNEEGHQKNKETRTKNDVNSDTDTSGSYNSCQDTDNEDEAINQERTPRRSKSEFGLDKISSNKAANDWSFEKTLNLWKGLETSKKRFKQSLDNSKKNVVVTKREAPQTPEKSKRPISEYWNLPDSSQSVAVSEEATFRNESLEAHNDYREKHGAPPLHLDLQLCKYSQEWANHLARTGSFQHRNNNKHGENLFMCSGQKFNGRTAVDEWYSEIKDYTFGYEPRSTGTGHFTQVVWKGTTDLGVAYATSRRGSVIVVANYNPPGNFMRQYTRNVLPPIHG